MRRNDAVRARVLRAPFLLAASLLLWTSCTRDTQSPTGLKQAESELGNVKGGNGNGNGKGGGGNRTLVLAAAPSGAIGGLVFTTQPAVEIHKTNGDLALISDDVTVAITAGGAPALLTGTLTVTSTDGVAQFTDLAITSAGTYTLEFTASGASSVSAVLVVIPPTAPLDLALIGTGSGTVTSSPAGIDCGATCSALFNLGSTVTLTATPAANSDFTGWTGAGCSGTGTCDVSISAAASVTAAFTLKTFTLTVARGGAGKGTVTSSPAGIDCGADCDELYDAGTSVTLTANPSPDSDFNGWSGGGCVGTGTCVVAMDAAASVAATFTRKLFALDVTLAGNGNGLVTSSPRGIDCGADCAEPFTIGTMVTLSAFRLPGSDFAGWSGGGCAGTGTCTVRMDAAVSVTATFTLQLIPVTVVPAGTGTGSVTSSPAGINCGADCTEIYAQGAVITLTATPASNSVFTGWSGLGCSGTGTCTVTATAGFPNEVTATFTLRTFTLDIVTQGPPANVISSPAGIDCPVGNACAAGFDAGTVVVLTAVPIPGLSVFVGWSGAGCSGTGTCTVTMNSATTVTATFTLQKFPLNVQKVGTGAGVVTASQPGINCGLDCTEDYNSGTTVTLTASSSSGSTFAGWSGAGCSGTGTCVVTMDGARTVSAQFTLQLFTLTVARAGAGAGTVTSSPSGINCGADCTEAYPSGTVITLTGTASAGNYFTGWSGGGCSGTGTCATTMFAAQTITATFSPLFTLSVARAGTGTGTVTSVPFGIDCGVDCTEDYIDNTTVVLTATPSSTSSFDGWSGAGCVGTGICTVTMSQARTVTATFSTITLTVTRAGAGTGTVTSSPAGINCGADCAEDYSQNTLVTLSAVAAPGSVFTNWQGSGCSGNGTCVVTMNLSRNIVANFALQTFTLTVVKTGPISAGTVTSNPAGISCGPGCTTAQADFPAGTVVQLNQTPSSGFIFGGWSGGGCAGTGTCSVTLSANTTITAPYLNAFPLNVFKSGTGTGTVTSVPAGINCGADCTEAYFSGTTVTLTATPAAGATFTGWSGSGCSGTGTCTVFVNQALNVFATFTVPMFSLNITKIGLFDGGTVTSNPAGITCGIGCSSNQASFPAGTVVQLTQTTNSGFSFDGWTNGGCSGTGVCNVTMNANISVTAWYSGLPRTLVVAKSGTGTGTVTSAPAGINCGADCTEDYPYNTQVTLTAAPSAGSTFTGWSGGGCSGTGTCVVGMSAANTVTATFTLQNFTLTLTKVGLFVAGTVTSNPAGISCGTGCGTDQRDFPAGTVVQLTQVPAPGFAFGGWIGGGCAGTGVCSVTMNANTSIAAPFTAVTATLDGPPTVDFGSTFGGAPVERTFSISNAGPASTGALTAVLQNTTNYVITANGCAGVNLGSGNSCSMTIRFAPITGGILLNTLTVQGPNTVSPLSVALRGAAF